MTVQARVGRLRPPSGSTYAAAVLADSPNAYWRLDEPSGTSFADLSGNGLTGTLQSTGWTRNVASATAQLGVAVTFPGTTGVYGRIPNDNLMQPLANCTYEAWINPARVNVNQVFMGKDFNSTGSNTDQMYFGISNTAALYAGVSWNGNHIVSTSVASMVVGTWYYVVCVRAGNPGNWQIFVNGASATTNAASTFTLVQTDAAFTIGSLLPTENNNPFSGTVDEVAIYPTALTSTQIAAHYAARV